jgi:FixJ family two-component response regulator
MMVYTLNVLKLPLNCVNTTVIVVKRIRFHIRKLVESKLNKIPMSILKPLTIIIADDDCEDLELLKTLFQNNEQFSLKACLCSGREVFDEIIRKKNVPDVLLIDMYMPFFTGIEVVKALENMDAGADMIKFVISTTAHIPEQSQHLDNPNIVFLKKPVTIQQMKELPDIILETLLQRSNLHSH